MAEERMQSPHYIPELDPYRNGSDEGVSDVGRVSAFYLLVGGLIGIAIGLVAGKQVVTLASAAGVAVAGIAFWAMASLKKGSRGERK